MKEASLLVKTIQKELVLKALNKNDKSPVTVADFASQAIIGYRLQQDFPGAVLVGEEDSTAIQQPDKLETLQQVTKYVRTILPDATSDKVCRWIDIGNGEVADEYWTVDPIDGTKGFLRGDQYVVALAFVCQGKVEIGILGCPNLTNANQPDFNGVGSLVFAVRGQGTWFLPMDNLDQQPVQLKVSDCNNPKEAQILRSFESGHTNADEIQNFMEVIHTQSAPIRMDSQAKYAMMAAGNGEILLRLLSPKAPAYKEKIWDQAAGSIIVEEAGGKITDLNGNALNFSIGRLMTENTGVLATNGQLHEAALATIKAVQ